MDTITIPRAVFDRLVELAEDVGDTALVAEAKGSLPPPQPGDGASSDKNEVASEENGDTVTPSIYPYPRFPNRKQE